MRRRRLLGAGLAATAVLALGGGAPWWLHKPAWQADRLWPAGRAVLRAVALPRLDGSLPEETASRAAAIESHLVRLHGSAERDCPLTPPQMSVYGAVHRLASGQAKRLTGREVVLAPCA
jgi:hypothetical protein